VAAGKTFIATRTKDGIAMRRRRTCV